MNILIVETVWMGSATYKFLDKTLLTAFSILPTLQAREIAAITPKHHKVTVVNERYTPIDYEEKYDVVHINFVISTTPHAFEIADAFRKKHIPVVLSGLHVGGMLQEAKQHADSVLIGRPELAWLIALRDIEQHNLQPFYEAPPFDDSVQLPPLRVSLPGFVATGALEATRGCPYQCDFCSETSTTGSLPYYERPVDEVVAEIQHIPQKILMFYDSSLTIHPDYTKTLFTKLRGMHKKCFCNGNANVLACDQELVRLSKEAGCVAWLIGFESVSQQTLDAVGKTTNLVDEYARAVRNIHRYGMIVIGCFMFGFDTDTPEVFDNTLQVINDLGIDIADFSILTPFPGTPLYQRLMTEGRILTNNWEYYNMGNVVFTPKQMTPEQLQNGVWMMYNRFYAPPYALKRILRSLRWGTYPFLVIVARNMVSMMSRRRVSTPLKND
ncbi:MAG TPA: radical SAM protein [Candidatus Thermoplasmatota archaeon]|nr:radical SAM protein [Candidatus Thermoplasmatota archaeon]